MNKILPLILSIWLMSGLWSAPVTAGETHCQEFRWLHAADVEVPLVLDQARKAMAQGKKRKALASFKNYIASHPTGVLTEGATFAVAALGDSRLTTETSKLQRIDALKVAQETYPDSPYNPWALCTIGDLYREVGWWLEARGAYERFLNRYANSPLRGGVLVGLGRSFYESRQYLEAALVFRRVLDEPNSHDFYLEAALGVADAAADSGAWKLARYWYRTVEVEKPEAIRLSPVSSYRYGLAELETGGNDRAIDRLLTTYNIHPRHDDAGRALNRIAETLFARGNEIPALWFSYLAVSAFGDREPGKQGYAGLIRWAISNLRQQRTEEEMDKLLEQFREEFSIAPPNSWEEVRTAAEQLTSARKPDLAGEAWSWVGESYEAQEKQEQAVEAYKQLFNDRYQSQWGQKAAVALTSILSEDVRGYFVRQRWADLIIYLDKQRNLLARISPEPTFWLMGAEGYRRMGLPHMSLNWYDQVLAHHTTPELREEALVGKVLVAKQSGHLGIVKEAAATYLKAYPSGRWSATISSALGDVAVSKGQFDAADQYYATAFAQASADVDRRLAGRQLASVRLARGKPDKAIRVYQTLVETETSDPRDRLKLADLLFESGQYQRASTEYTKLIDILTKGESLLWVRYRLALCYQKGGEQDKARALFAQLRQQNDQNGRLGEALRRMAMALGESLTVIGGKDGIEK